MEIESLVGQTWLVKLGGALVLSPMTVLDVRGDAVLMVLHAPDALMLPEAHWYDSADVKFMSLYPTE